MIYIYNWTERYDGLKKPQETKNKPRLVSLPSPLYDMENRLFSNPKSGPKISQAFPIGVGLC